MPNLDGIGASFETGATASQPLFTQPSILRFP
jgi:hypothetical protein